MQFLRQVLCNPQRNAKVLQRGLSGGSPASQNDTEEQPLQSRPANHGDTASGVSHLFQSSHTHGLFPTVHIYKLVAMGKLKASRISNRMAFIRRADIERMLESNPYHRILPGSTSTPKKSASSSFPAKKEKREKVTDEVPDFYSGEEVMSLYKVKQSWLYTTAKRNRIPICRIAGKNYYSKKHVDEFFGVAVDMESITDWLLTEEAEELFGMKPAALRAYAYRHRIPTKREYGRTYYSKSHLDELRRTDLVNDERYYTVEQVRQIYGLSSANICHIVKVKHIEKIKVGVKNLLLRSDVERVMAERNK